MTPSKERVVLIDLIRALSISLVLAVHLGMARFTQGLDHPVSYAWNLFARNGPYGVCLFFVLSGFLITQILMRTQPDFSSISLRDFYARRAGRILPLLIFVVLIGTFFLVGPLAHSKQLLYSFYSKGSPKGLGISIATFSFNWYAIWREHFGLGIGQHWGVLWSISVEEQFYLFYPLLLKALGSIGNVLKALLVVVVVGPLYRWWAYRMDPHNYLLSLAGSFGAFDQIAIGCLLFFISHKTMPWLKKYPGIAFSLIAAGASTLIMAYINSNIYAASDRIFAPSQVALGLFLILWGGLSFRIKNTLFTQMFCLPGQMSYGIYLLHTTVLFLGWSHWNQTNPWAAFTLFLSANTAVAALSYYAFELPANYWVRRQFITIFGRYPQKP